MKNVLDVKNFLKMKDLKGNVPSPVYNSYAVLVFSTMLLSPFLHMSPCDFLCILFSWTFLLFLSICAKALRFVEGLS